MQKLAVVAAFAIISIAMMIPAPAFARGGHVGGGTVGARGGRFGGPGFNGAGHYGAGHYGAGHYGAWGHRGYAPYRGGYHNWGYRSWGYPYYGYGWGYPYYGFAPGFAVGVGIGSGAFGGYGYGGYGYGWGYGYPAYGYYDYYASAPATAVYGPSPPPPSTPGPDENATLAPPAANRPHGEQSASAQEFTDRGEAAFKKGDYQSAVYAWRHAVVDDPQNAVNTLMLAQALLATAQYEEAAGATQAAMRLMLKEDWGTVVRHYRELYGRAEDYSDQLRALERAIKEKPGNPALRFLAGYHFAYLGFNKQALEQLAEGLEIAPRDEMARQLRDLLQNKVAKPELLPPARDLQGPELQSVPTAARN